MALRTINDETLSAIAEAIRDKNGETTTYKPGEMPAAIAAIETGGSDDGLTAEDLAFSGEVPAYTLSGSLGTKLVSLYGNLISFTDVNKAEYLFSGNTADLSGLTVNVKNLHPQNFMRRCAANKLPKLVGTTGTSASYAQYMCSGLSGVSEIPSSFYEGVDWSTNYVGMYYAFDYCQYLRKAPIDWIKTIKKSVNSLYAGYQGVFNYCRCLDEIIGYPVNTGGTFTSNIMNTFASNCWRLANLTFEMNEDGTPIVAQWKGQTFDLSNYIGYASDPHSLISDVSGITADKQVTDDATYQALKDDPDWFTLNMQYGRFNHDSAVRTINSLPDTSAYLATAGGTNTIKFRGKSGELTDGGAINTLTEEEIAVATAKGWTVTLV